MIQPCPDLSLSCQCQLVQIRRSSLYYQPVGESADRLELMGQIDRLYMHYPFYGSRQLVQQLRCEGRSAGALYSQIDAVDGLAGDIPGLPHQ